MSKWRKLAVIPALTATLGLAACAGAGRPSVEDIKDAMQQVMPADLEGIDQAVIDDMTDCMAKGMHESDISDQTLNDMVEAAKKGEDQVVYSNEEEKAEAEKITTDLSMQCAEEAMGDPTGGL